MYAQEKRLNVTAQYMQLPPQQSGLNLHHHTCPVETIRSQNPGAMEAATSLPIGSDCSAASLTPPTRA